MATRRLTKKRTGSSRSRISSARIAAMIEQATTDAYDESEQATGWYTMLEEHLQLPFETTILGVVVTVTRLDLRGDNQIAVVCTRGRDRQIFGICDLPLPPSRPAGAEWIEAYRAWARRR